MAAHEINSEEWTGCEAPAVKKSRLDVWADAHPLKALAFCVCAISLIGALDVHGASNSLRALIFTGEFVALALVYGSMLGGVWLLGQFLMWIDKDRVDGLNVSQKSYLFGLLLVGISLSMSTGPVLIFKLLGYVVRFI